ncbi:NAD(P)/FAD-dependent oxidoreductase [Streptomyces sp. SP18CS02]|uniref:NAD(P)/FAD-dependent oxidoreductase n=1 Tax=Streptomyces sp. SP18CS02 TaxID=3002531 RepID=UPI002E79221D|nr:NAD(P)/FAD-dependent oxidoreductase [Streptomyces sp. SP18CS02]MEE1756485.1 NAD(P)/FAD-dependent oxidoreductase [Streptomyces sp. SP18CS02]
MPTTSPEPVDLAIVGAGPAGLAAAVDAAGLGLNVTLLDAGERPGGQIYRHPAPGLGLGEAHPVARRLMRRMGDVRYLPGHHVWTVVRESDGGSEETADGGGEETTDGGGEETTDGGGRSTCPGHGHSPSHSHGPRRDTADHTDSGNSENIRQAAGTWLLHAVVGPEETPATVRARAVLLATGAYERQLPFPGWTLPGVVGAGGAQAMLKSGLVTPGRRTVVAGSGPLLLAVARSLADAGVRVPAVVEAAGYPAYARHLPALVRNPGKLAEGVVHGTALLRRTTRLLGRHAVTAAHGTGRVEAVTVMRLDHDWRPLPGSARRIPCDALAVGHGLVPQLELATGLGCATRRAPDGTPALELDDRQRTSVPGVWAAGETGGIGGAELALTEGRIAALDIARDLRAAPPRPRTPAAPPGVRPAALAALSRRRARLRAFADAMATAHRPGPGWTDWLDATTEVCRCEEVPAGRIRQAVSELGAHDARTVKLLTRAGMGWCQGRMCGQAVARLAGEDPAPDRRPLSCPVPLRHLAQPPGAE